MPPSPSFSHPFLIYSVPFRALICQQCAHAIQKSALESHLLKHKIYRSERRDLLASIAALDIPEPEDVVYPDSSSSCGPVDGIDVLEGWVCAERCGYMTISEKRLRLHWNEVHHGEGGDRDSLGRKAKLQTLFRGTKTRYFEVHSLDTQGPTDQDEEDTSLPALLDAIRTSQPLQSHTLHADTFHHFKTSISTLPYRMATNFGRPEASDIHAILTALATLSTCGTLVFEADAGNVAYRSAVSWLSLRSARYGELLESGDHGALVVLGHWAWLLAAIEGDGKGRAVLGLVRGKIGAASRLLDALQGG